ncbi:MAG: DUF2207 domain-containing protein [Nitratireductor sp.]|nr:DUF2207 domain-containing protein [Nitratireductor sp.]
MNRLFAALAIFLLALSPLVANAREEIRSFNAEITVNTDASIEVTEIIAVNAQGIDIRRGIYRDIPLSSTDDRGFKDQKGFELLDVLFDGEPSAYHTEWQGRFFRIYIGDPNTFVQHGAHTYTIRYRTTGQLRHFDTYDELYWNVTGEFWTFPILNAEARIKLPDGAVATQIKAYTGAYGASASNYEASGEGTATPTFKLTRALNSYEGMTIAVGFTKGVVTVQSQAEGWLSFLWSNKGLFLIYAGWLFVPLYYLVAWFRVGRDPVMETVIPLFHPPENLSPAAMSYVHFNTFRRAGRGSDLAFIAALLALGVKKLLLIDQDERKKITFRRGVNAGNVAAIKLPAGESALFAGLLGSRQELPLNKSTGKTLLSATSMLHSAITREYAGKFYRNNIGWFIPGIIVGLIATIGGLILQNPSEDALSMVLPAIFATILGCAAMVGGGGLYEYAGRSGLARIGGAALIAVGAAAIAAIAYFTLTYFSMIAWQVAAILIIVGICMAALMLFLLGAPTIDGARVLSRIKGFKLYLETAETNRLNLRDAPQMSEELYERYLPYAAGLGVEEPWSKAWAAHLSRVAPGREHDYHPAWYRGNSWDSNSIGTATAASVAAVSAAMAAAMPQPQSSSGSSGGGFSGGGGGGGGGGGW